MKEISEGREGGKVEVSHEVESGEVEGVSSSER
jgi:hypothetical protein